MATNNDKQQQQQHTEQSQHTHFQRLAAETPSIANPLGLPYNPLTHWGNVGPLRTPYTTYSRTPPNDEQQQQQQQQQQQASNISNPRKKNYEEKMDKQRLEHILFSGDPSSLNQQKERMRQKLILKQNKHKNQRQRHCNGNNKRKSKQNKNKHKKNTHNNNNNNNGNNHNKQNGKKKKKSNEIKQIENNDDTLNVTVNTLNEDGLNINNKDNEEEEDDERESMDLIDAVDGMLEDESISINDDDDDVALKELIDNDEIESRPVCKEMNKENGIERVSVDGKDVNHVNDDEKDVNDDKKDVLLMQQREEINGLKQRVFRLEKIVDTLSNKLELMEERKNNNNNMDGIEGKYDGKSIGSKREKSRSVGLSDDGITIKPERIDIASPNWSCIECDNNNVQNNGHNVNCYKCGAIKDNKLQSMSLLNKASISSTPSSNGNTTDSESDDTDNSDSESLSSSNNNNKSDIDDNIDNMDIMKEIICLKQRVNDIESGKLEIQRNNNCDHEAIREWLINKVKLGQYFQIFIENGFDDMLAMKTLTMEILDNIKGIDKIGHKSRILYFVERLNNINEDNLDSTHEF